MLRQSSPTSPRQTALLGALYGEFVAESLQFFGPDEVRRNPAAFPIANIRNSATSPCQIQVLAAAEGVKGESRIFWHQECHLSGVCSYVIPVRTAVITCQPIGGPVVLVNAALIEQAGLCG